MGRGEVINAKNRISDESRRLPHLQSVGLAGRSGDYFLLVSLLQDTPEAEKTVILQLAGEVPVEFQLSKAAGFVR